MRTALLVLLIATAYSSAAPGSAEPLVDTDAGALRGTLEGDVAVYRGIPYAAPPVGPLRWRPPQPVAEWTGVRNGTTFGAACPQGAPPGVTDLTAVGGAAGPYSEDCLTLNVWAPQSARKAPVMLWIHGGSFRMGAGSLSAYDGTSFAGDGIVLVTINYRLGNLGYFAHPALTRAAGPGEPLGNYAVMDQIAALAWVQRNAAAFGGDPGNVTIFGESSGGVNVLTLLTVERARGLFHKAIVQSGGGWWPNIPLALAEARGIAFATAAGLPGSEAAAEALRALPAESMVDPGGAFIPFVDRRLITEAPTRVLAEGRAADVPLVVGANSGEDSLLGYGGRAEAFAATLPPHTLTVARNVYPAELKEEQLLRQLFADSWFVAPARWVAARSAAGEPSFLYHFSYVEERKRETQSTAHHGAEIYHVFETLDRPLSERPPPTERDWRVAHTLHGCWVSFARSGVPDCPGGQNWPAYDPQSDEVMEFGNDGSALRQGLRATELDWIEDWFLRPLLEP